MYKRMFTYIVSYGSSSQQPCESENHVLLSNVRGPREGTNYNPGNKLENDGGGIQTYVFLLLILTSDQPASWLENPHHHHHQSNPLLPTPLPPTLGQWGDLHCVDTEESKPSSAFPGRKSTCPPAVDCPRCGLRVHLHELEHTCVHGRWNSTPGF